MGNGSDGPLDKDENLANSLEAGLPLDGESFLLESVPPSFFGPFTTEVDVDGRT